MSNRLQQPHNEEFWECSRKQKYSKKTAKRRASEYRNQKKSIPLFAYHCPWCDYWHIGHEKGWKKQEVQKFNDLMKHREETSYGSSF